MTTQLSATEHGETIVTLMILAATAQGTVSLGSMISPALAVIAEKPKRESRCFFLCFPTE